MKKRTLPMILLILTTLSFSSFTAAALVRTVSVARKQQEETNWCWAACAQMIGNAYGVSKTQKQICIDVKGKSVNNAATNAEVLSAIKFSIKGNSKKKSAYSYNGAFSFTQVINSIYSGNLICIKMVWDSNNGAHALVLNGYDDSDGTVRLIDLAKNCGAKWFERNKLVNGTTIQSGEGKYKYTWFVE